MKQIKHIFTFLLLLLLQLSFVNNFASINTNEELCVGNIERFFLSHSSNTAVTYQEENKGNKHFIPENNSPYTINGQFSIYGTFNREKGFTTINVSYRKYNHLEEVAGIGARGSIDDILDLIDEPYRAALRTDLDLAKIQGFSGASYDEVVTQINRLLDNHSGSTLNGFENVIGTMARTGSQQADNAKKGMYWMIRNLADDTEYLAGKNLTIEFGIPNARGTTSRIDIFCSNCDVPNLKIEYKSGPGSITSKTIKEQFIQRDLFNASRLDEIQWRMDGTEFTPNKLMAWLKENKASLNEVKNKSNDLKDKFTDWFDLDDVNSSITNSNIDDFVEDNFELIFR